MPRQDKTGPMGMGPGTGRGMGPCGGGLGKGRGFGRVMCGWHWRQFQSLPKDEKKELLSGEIEDLKEELKMVEEELKELEK